MKVSKFSIVLLLVGSIVLIASVVSSADNKIHFVYNKDWNTPPGKYLTMIYAEAFKRLGYPAYPFIDWCNEPYKNKCGEISCL
jgi:hypothetical protein